MADVEKYANEILEISNLTKEFQKKLSHSFGGSMQWGVEQFISSYLSLFDRFCPLSVGDRVELVRNVPVKESSGWYHCRHFLIKDATATVRNRGYKDDHFTFDIEFDHETWIDQEGNEQPVKNKHTFYFTEDFLRKI